MKDILGNYEHSITRDFAVKEARHAEIDFPCDGPRTFEWLAQCVKRYDIVDDIMDAFASSCNCFAVEQHNMSLCNVGLLLLYRLESCGK